MNPKRLFQLGLLTLLIASPQLSSLFAQGTAFTYQGRLNDGTNTANGLYEIQFTLFNAQSNGNQVGAQVALAPVAVSNGLFTALLDFGAVAFDGSPRWLEITLNLYGSDMLPTTLSSRQPITAAPYAITARNVTGVIPSNGLAGAYSAPVTFNHPANAFTGSGAGLTSLNASQLTSGTVPAATLANAWQIVGNAGTIPGTHFLGTTDNQPLEIKVNGFRALRLEPHATSPNVIGGFSGNFIGAGYVGSTIGGGGNLNFSNAIYTSYATIAGGTGNDIGTNSSRSAIGGGSDNNIAANSQNTTIAGGLFNDVGTNSSRSVISGGSDNNIADNSAYATIAGGVLNDIGTRASRSAIGGGNNNNIARESQDATIAGGSSHDIGPDCVGSAIGGGSDNNIAEDSDGTTIAGGSLNDVGVESSGSAIGGGYDNNIAENSADTTIAGGSWNDIGGESRGSAIGGGSDNKIAGVSFYATIAGGTLNDIGTNSPYSAIGGGNNNNIAANSRYATIPGGFSNFATNQAFAAGTRAKANHSGAFVWGDSTALGIASTNANSVTMRASGGYRLFSNGSANLGVYLAPNGGSFTSISDRNAKENFEPVDAGAVLKKVAALPLSSWNYKGQTNGVRHIGPMAQDFKAAFGVGETDTGITTVDADGVALAAIQGLNQKLTEELKRRDAENAELKARLTILEQVLTKLAEKGD